MTTDINYASQLRFQFFIEGFDREYTCNSITTPSIDVQELVMPTPFAPVHLPGEVANYGQLSLTFLVSSDLKNYTDLLEWLQAMSFPENYEQRTEFLKTKKEIADGFLSVLNVSNVEMKKIKFIGIHPISLSGLAFTTKDSESTPLEATVEFKITGLSI